MRGSWGVSHCSLWNNSSWFPLFELDQSTMRQILNTVRLFSFCSLPLCHPSHRTSLHPPPVDPRATQITENPSEFSRSRQPSAESPFKRSPKSRPVFTPSRLVCGRIIVTGRVALRSSSATDGGNDGRRRGRSTFAAGWSSVYAVLPSLFTFVLWCCSQGDSVGVWWHEEAAATPFNMFYKKSVSVLDRGKHLVWTENVCKTGNEADKSCLTVTRFSSTLVLAFLFCGPGLFFSHIVSTLHFPCSCFCKKVSHTCLKFIGSKLALRLWQLFTHSLGLWKLFVPVSRRGWRGLTWSSCLIKSDTFFALSSSRRAAATTFIFHRCYCSTPNLPNSTFLGSNWLSSH